MGKAVVPDLPYVHPDVPDDSEAPENSGRFAGLVRGRGLWPWSASIGTNEYRLAAVRRCIQRMRRVLLVGLGVSVASAVWCTLLTPETFADETTSASDPRQISQTRRAERVQRASGRPGSLSPAPRLSWTWRRAKLAQTQVTGGGPNPRRQGRGQLKKPGPSRGGQAAVIAGQREIEQGRCRPVTGQYQQQSNHMPVSPVVGQHAEDLRPGLQWSTTCRHSAGRVVSYQNPAQARTAKASHRTGETGRSGPRGRRST